MSNARESSADDFLPATSWPCGNARRTLPAFSYQGRLERALRVPPFSLNGNVFENSPERTRARREARRSEPLTARTVLKRSGKKEGRRAIEGQGKKIERKRGRFVERYTKRQSSYGLAPISWGLWPVEAHSTATLVGTARYRSWPNGNP